MSPGINIPEDFEETYTLVRDEAVERFPEDEITMEATIWSSDNYKITAVHGSNNNREKIIYNNSAEFIKYRVENVVESDRAIVVKEKKLQSQE